MKKTTNILLVIIAISLQSCIGGGANSEIKQLVAQENVTKSTKTVAAKFFPHLVGNDLHGKERVLPKAFVGKINLVAVAFMRKQQADVDSWLPVFEEMSKQNAAVKFYEIPLISERNAFRRTMINNGMRSGVKSKEARERTITVYTDREKFFAMTSTKEEQITIFVVDANGKILWRVDGVSSDAGLNNLRKAVKKALGEFK